MSNTKARALTDICDEIDKLLKDNGLTIEFEQLDDDDRPYAYLTQTEGYLKLQVKIGGDRA